MSNESGEVHCFIDNQEVPLQQCDLEHESSNNENPREASSEKLIEDRNQEAEVPTGSSIVSIIIKKGLIVEKVFQTTEGKKISIKGLEAKE